MTSRCSPADSPTLKTMDIVKTSDKDEYGDRIKVYTATRNVSINVNGKELTVAEPVCALYAAAPQKNSYGSVYPCELYAEITKDKARLLCDFLLDFIDSRHDTPYMMERVLVPLQEASILEAKKRKREEEDAKKASDEKERVEKELARKKEADDQIKAYEEDKKKAKKGKKVVVTQGSV